MRGRLNLDKYECIQEIKKRKIISVIRTKFADQTLELVKAVKKGGIKLIEITMTNPSALESLKKVKEQYVEEEVIVGAGTVLDAETARDCILAGAEYIISPNFNPEVIKMCNRYGKLAIPGVMTVTEIVNAMDIGVEIFKIFPGKVLGPDFIKAVRGPLPNVKLMPSGGVALDNVEKWFDSGAFAVSVGGKITSGGEIGDYKLVEEKAKQFVDKIELIK